MTITSKVYSWGCHPHNLRQVASSMRHGKSAGRYIPEQTSFLNPFLVDTTCIQGNIVKVTYIYFFCTARSPSYIYWILEMK